MRIPLVPALAAGLLALAVAAPALADNVYLTNGKSFEGVVAKVDDAHVRIQMPGGEIRLPRTSVERVEQGDSAFATYLERKQALGKHGTAAEWLDLARWASAQGLDQGAREAALKAAAIDPHLSGLAPILRAQGYVYDRDLERYIPYADAMHRRGLVNAGGHWITREEQQAEQAEARREREDLAKAQAVRSASDAQRQLAELQLYQQEAAVADSANPAYYAPYGFSLGAFPGFFPPFSGHRGHGGFRGQGSHGGFHGHVGGGHGGSGSEALGFHGFSRVPGSLFPVGAPARRP
jgi:hypothetical protein